MATPVVSSIIFSLLFIIFSLIADGKAFAAYREHRKLSGGKETTTMRRNLEGNGNDGSKTAVHGSISNPRHSGQKNTQHEPSKTLPNQEPTHAQQRHALVYRALQRRPVLATNNCTSYYRCRGAANNMRRPNTTTYSASNTRP